jgi:SAM-dependent methyltransferase
MWLESLRRLIRELGGAPTPAEAEALQARAFAKPAWLEPYAAPSYVESGLTDTERDLLARYLVPGERLLDVGCGTGREALGFARAGLVVTALDACREAVARAPRHERVTFATGGLSDLEGEPGSFDAAFLSSDVYGAIPGRENRVAALARLARLVRPGGPILVPAARATGRRSRLRALLEAVGWLVPGDRFARGPDGELLYRHVFADESELSAEAAAAGLSFERAGPDYFIARAERRRYRAHPSVRSEPHGGELVLVHMELGTTFRLNATGRAIFALAREGLSAGEVAARLRAELAADERRLEADARELMLELARARLLVPAT